MIKPKYIVYFLKDFLGMLSLWQLDHAFSWYVWEANVMIEIARFFTVEIVMWEKDFWILCFFVFILALFLPEMFEAVKHVNGMLKRRHQQ